MKCGSIRQNQLLVKELPLVKIGLIVFSVRAVLLIDQAWSV